MMCSKATEEGPMVPYFEVVFMLEAFHLLPAVISLQPLMICQHSPEHFLLQKGMTCLSLQIFCMNKNGQTTGVESVKSLRGLIQGTSYCSLSVMEECV
jgi:hypothetical protein